MGRRFPLSESATVKLDASGNGTLKMGPTRRGQTWYPTLIAVSIPNPTKIPTATVTNGSIGLGQTFTGSGDSTDLAGAVVYPGQQITITWAGGDANAVATASITGDTEQW